MPHVRRQIRERAATTLTGLATTGPRVHQGRIFALADLPALCIWTSEETSVAETLSPPRSIVRRLMLVIEGYARASYDVEDTLDAIAQEVEVAMYGDRTLGGLAKDSNLIGTDVRLSDEGDRPHGIIKMMYEVAYVTREGSPDIAI